MRSKILTILGILVVLLLYGGVLQTAKISSIFLWACLIIGAGMDLIEVLSSTRVFKVVGDFVVWSFYFVLLHDLHAGIEMYLLLVLYIAGYYISTFTVIMAAGVAASAVLDLEILIKIHASVFLYFLLLLKWILFAVVSRANLLS